VGSIDLDIDRRKNVLFFVGSWLGRLGCVASRFYLSRSGQEDN
jgi:hypothetical protein